MTLPSTNSVRICTSREIRRERREKEAFERTFAVEDRLKIIDVRRRAEEDTFAEGLIESASSFLPRAAVSDDLCDHRIYFARSDDDVSALIQPNGRSQGNHGEP